MARGRKGPKAPKLPKGGGSFERTGKFSAGMGQGQAAAKASAKKAAARKAGFSSKHPRDKKGRFRNK